MEVVIGIDFGTSYTKVCVRGEDMERSEVVTFAGTTLNGSLLSTKVAIMLDGSLIAGLTESEWDKSSQCAEVVIDFIKMRLANFDLQHEGKWFEFRPLFGFGKKNLNQEKFIENLCSYYLAKVIARTQKWFIDSFPDRIKNIDIKWNINVGVPVRYCNSKALERFEKVLKLGFLLSNLNELQNIDLITLENVIKANTEYLENDELHCYVVPEIAAGTYSFTASRNASPGEYVFIDIGSGTIESVAFSFTRDKSRPELKFIAPYVYPLGVETLIEGVAKASKSSVSQVQEIILKNIDTANEINLLTLNIDCSLYKGDYIASVGLITQKCIERLLDKSNLNQRDRMILELILWQMAIHLQTAKVINYQKSTTELFLGGGGANIDFYKNTIANTHSAFHQSKAHVDPYIIKDIPTPHQDDCFMSGLSSKHFHRFAIAYGLSLPIYEMPIFALPQSSHSAQVGEDLLKRDAVGLATVIRQESKPLQQVLRNNDFREYSNRGLGGRIQD